VALAVLRCITVSKIHFQWTITSEEAIRTEPKRFDELDSLRGLAAISVLMHHFLLVKDSSSQQESILRIFLYPFQNGPAAVVLFFTLSGFVLSLPVWRETKISYPHFVLRRTFRIYPPYLFALLLSVAGAYLFHSHKQPHLSLWFQGSWSTPVDPDSVLQHLLFIGPKYQAAQYNTVFWTLILEMQISLIFPILMNIVRHMPSGGEWLLAGFIWMLGLVLSYLFPLSSLGGIIYWSSFFVAGAISARLVLTKPSPFSRIFTRTSTLSFSLMLLVCSTFIGHSGSNIMMLISYLPCGIGSLGTVFCAIYHRSFHRLLQAAVPTFLGRISYSLYLLHAIVLNICFHILYPSWSFSAIFLPYALATLILATLFHKFVEKPAIQLGRWLTSGHTLKKVYTTVLSWSSRAS
jgi:peptidoglycan/LPS O-acetylase OafA/YrhL